MYTCRECETGINQATEICPHCGTDLTQSPAGEPVARPKPPLGKVLLRWASLLTVLLAALWSFLWFVVSPRSSHATAEAEAQAIQALGDARAALDNFASAQGGVYPQTLEQLGPPVRQAAQSAQSQGYRLLYMPGSPNPDGGIRNYGLEARAGNYGYRNFYEDASGVIHATRENRGATSLDPPIH